MLRGILHVYWKLRPGIANRPAEMAILQRQITRFEAELLAAEARLALEIADFEAAQEYLGALPRATRRRLAAHRPFHVALGSERAQARAPFQEARARAANRRPHAGP
jgi:hypothetical protein